MNSTTRLLSAAAAAGLVVTTGVATMLPATAATTAAQDAFGRTVSSGWGSADAGGSWKTGSGTFSVASSQGLMTVAPGSTASAVVADVTSSDSDVAADFTPDRAATGGGQYVSVLGRGTAATGYRATARVQSDGAVVLSVRKTSAGKETILATQTVSGLTAGAGVPLRVRLSVSGTSSVALKAKVWKVGSTEPSSWTVSATDASSPIAASGQVGVLGYVSSSATNGSSVFKVDNFVAEVGSTTSSGSTTTTTTSTTKPGASNTGVPDITLKVLSASNKPYSADTFSSDGTVFTIKTAGAVYDGWRFDSFVVVEAPNVVLRNSYFRGTTTSSDRGLLRVAPEKMAAGQPSATIEDSTFIPRSPSYHINGIMGSNFTAKRVEITGTVDGIHIHGTSSRTDATAGNVKLLNSWIHDLPHYANDGGVHSDGSHNDGIQIVGGKNITIQWNTFNGTFYNAALQITQDRNTVSAVTYTDNWTDGGGCSVNVAQSGYAAIQGLKLQTNKFGRGSTYGCPMIINAATASIATVTGNVWEDGKTPLPKVITN